MAIRRYLCLVLVILFSAGGLYTSVHLVHLHYKKPKYMLNLLNALPVLEKWYDREALEAAAGAPGGDGSFKVNEEGEVEYDPYAAAFEQADNPFNNVATEEELSGGFQKEETCDLSEEFSCTAVDESEYSEILGISVSLYGVAGYGIMILLSAIALFTQKKRLDAGEPRRPDFVLFLVFMGCVTGFVFSAWLTYLEAYEIESFCPYCLASAAFMTLALIAALAGFGIAPVTNYFSKRS